MQDDHRFGTVMHLANRLAPAVLVEQQHIGHVVEPRDLGAVNDAHARRAGANDPGQGIVESLLKGGMLGDQVAIPLVNVEGELHCIDHPVILHEPRDWTGVLWFRSVGP